MRQSAVLILTAALRDAGNQLAVAMGHDTADPPNTYCVPLCPNGEGAPTHYGTHTWVTDGFRATIEAAQGGTYPAWPPEMLALAQEVIGGLIASFEELDARAPSEHFNAVAAGQGLALWVDPNAQPQ